jgi:MoxR-like ATPase/predicted RNA-binding protein with PUA-like domain
MPRVAEAEAVYEAAGRWVEVALRTDDSLFTPGVAIWTSPVIDDLYRRFVEQPDESKRHFEEKFRDQLAGAPSSTMQLAAELLYVHFLPAADISGGHKQTVIDTVLSWSPERVQIPADLAGALDHGIASVGVAFKTYRPFQLFYLLEFIKAWKALDATDREALLSDPWAFKRFSFDLPARAAQSQRAALLNLVHPEAFEPITSEGTKKKIAAAFSEYVQTDSPDIDRQLAEIRAALNDEYGRIFMFWDDDVRPRWSPVPANGEPSTESRAWLFQANPDYFELDAALASLDSIEWTVKRYPSTEVHAGDRAYIWRSGSQTGGIVAVGSIVSETYDAPPDPAEAPYWKSERFKGVQPRVRIAIDRVLDQPLLRSALREDPVLKDLHVIRAPRGTVYPVPLDHEARLRELLGEEGDTPGRVRYFVLQQRTDRGYEWDEEERVYHFTPNASGSWKQLSRSAGARFVYYRPGSGGGETAKSYFGHGRIVRVEEEQENGDRHFRAQLEGYQPFARPVPSSEYDPRPNAQMSIVEITRDQFEELLRRGSLRETVPFTVDSIVRAATREPRALLLDEATYASVFSALESGKHVVFTGPPGTAKTTLAEAVAEAAAEAGLCSGHVLTTATADWTTYETIGGLKPTRNGELAFAPGHFLEAVERNQWLVIDELNRSNFDRAFGQLFTVLSGQAVQLPYEREEQAGRLVLAPQGRPVAAGADVIRIPESWRVIATMNVFDKSLLFEMSFALMRRFAFIEVPSPPDPVFASLILRSADSDTAAAELAMRFYPLRQFKDLGPALYMDMARFLAIRRTQEPSNDEQLAYEAFYSYLLPQFEGIDQATGEQLWAALKPLVGSSNAERLRKTLNAVLGLEISAPRSRPDEEDEFALMPDEPQITQE